MIEAGVWSRVEYWSVILDLAAAGRKVQNHRSSLTQIKEGTCHMTNLKGYTCMLQVQTVCTYV